MSKSSNQYQAVYKFKGMNNDELTFDTGDVITVTQKEEGGWWEGTHSRRGKTGWFPTNYVRPYDEAQDEERRRAQEEKGGGGVEEGVIQRGIDYRQQVIQDLLEKERDFILGLTNVQKTYLLPLQHKGDPLNEMEYKQLVSNLEELLEAHKSFYDDVEKGSKSLPREQRIGKVFLDHGGSIKSTHMKYWKNHPKAVCILEQFRDALDSYMESKGASKPGLIVLTTSLSRPFRHLEKYAGICQELEQHFEDDHPDRGDTQRSIGFYKDVAAECAKARRQMELELEVLTGTIRGWEGEDLMTLGEIVHIGSVTINGGGEKKDRHFVLFSTTLLILSVSQRMSAFIYEGKLPLSGISVNRLEDIETVKNAFEITGTMIDRIVVTCLNKTDSLKWIEVLRSQIKASRNLSMSNSAQGNLPPPFPTPPPHVSLPYLLLTQWIAKQVDLGYLPLPMIPSSRAIANDFAILRDDSRVKKRTHRVECMFFQYTPEAVKKTLNPVPETESEDEFTLLVPDLMFSDYSSSYEDVADECRASWKRFPKKSEEIVILRSFETGKKEEESQRYSLPGTVTLDQNEKASQEIILDDDDSYVQRYYEKMGMHKTESIKWIESNSSTEAPFCPPIQLSYEEFPRLKDGSLLPHSVLRTVNAQTKRHKYKSIKPCAIDSSSPSFHFVAKITVPVERKVTRFHITPSSQERFKSHLYVHWWMKARLEQ